LRIVHVDGFAQKKRRPAGAGLLLPKGCLRVHHPLNPS
jgi:hypothetical protein